MHLCFYSCLCLRLCLKAALQACSEQFHSFSSGWGMCTVRGERQCLVFSGDLGSTREAAYTCSKCTDDLFSSLVEIVLNGFLSSHSGAFIGSKDDIAKSEIS